MATRASYTLPACVTLLTVKTRDRAHFRITRKFLTPIDNAEKRHASLGQ